MAKNELRKRDERGVRIQNYARYKEGVDFDKIQADDLAPILESNIQELKKTRGAITKYPNNAEGLQTFVDNTVKYFEYIKEANERTEGNRLIPDIEGWSAFIGITRKRIFEYQKERGEDWQEAIESIKNMIAACKKQLAQTGKIPPMVMAMDLVNNHDYVNTNEFHIISDTKDEKQFEDIAQIQERYKGVNDAPVELPKVDFS